MEYSYQILPRKKFFLTALTSGASILELEALSRDKNFIKFLPPGEVIPSPLAKWITKKPRFLKKESLKVENYSASPNTSS